MDKRIVFVAYQDQENLGIGYLSAALALKGFAIEIVDFGLGEDQISRLIRSQPGPLMVGFSLIFQYYFYRLQYLARCLRADAINCHFTVGGHYPSLRFESILDGIHEVDSVVRFEGELTACELAECLASGKDWRSISSIAYRENGKAVSNAIRPLIDDLDTIPFPVRIEKTMGTIMRKNCASILASRGCIRNCSFCSIRKFYSTPRGELRRTRTPENVVKEMRSLYDSYATRVFLFQDDDFILPGTLGRNWLNAFVNSLERESLSEKIAWKISCRSDEVDSGLFKRMRDAGLFSVYLGIESGNPAGLRIMNKMLEVDDNIRAVGILNNLGVQYDFGFMLLDPSSTFESVKTNISFLRELCGDGSSPVRFCKMIPYADTEIERRLASESRLKQSVTTPDYDFLDSRLDSFWALVTDIFFEWMYTDRGVLRRLCYHRYEMAVLERFYPYAVGVEDYKRFLNGIVASSNALVLDTVEKALSLCENNRSSSRSQTEELKHLIREGGANIFSKLTRGMNEFDRLQTRKKVSSVNAGAEELLTAGPVS